MHKVTEEGFTEVGGGLGCGGRKIQGCAGSNPQVITRAILWAITMTPPSLRHGWYIPGPPMSPLMGVSIRVGVGPFTMESSLDLAKLEPN